MTRCWYELAQVFWNNAHWNGVHLMLIRPVEFEINREDFLLARA